MQQDVPKKKKGEGAWHAQQDELKTEARPFHERFVNNVPV